MRKIILSIVLATSIVAFGHHHGHYHGFHHHHCHNGWVAPTVFGLGALTAGLLYNSVPSTPVVVQPTVVSPSPVVVSTPTRVWIPGYYSTVSYASGGTRQIWVEGHWEYR